MPVKTPALAIPARTMTADIENIDTMSVFICSHRDGAGAGFEPVSDLARPCSPLSPRSEIYLNFKREGVGVPKGITGLKGKRGKLGTRPLADRSICFQSDLIRKVRVVADTFAKSKKYARPPKFI